MKKIILYLIPCLIGIVGCSTTPTKAQIHKEMEAIHAKYKPTHTNIDDWAPSDREKFKNLLQVYTSLAH